MTLSTGTLNLRFMRNARPNVEPEQTHVNDDDGKWELPSDAWAQTAYRGEKAVTYETSYLPFLFPSLHDTPAADGPSSLSPSNTLPPRGRRLFNKPGQEITQEASPPSTDTAPPQNIVLQVAEQSNPRSISSTGVPGLSPRHSKKSSIHPPKKDPPFLRPAGVDGPINLTKASSFGPIHSKRSRTSGEAREPKKKTRLSLIE